MKSSFIFLMVAITSLASCNDPYKQRAAAKNKSSEMKARFNALNDAFNSGNTSAIDTLLAADAIDYSEDTSLHLPKGPEGLKQFITMMRQASPDLKSEVKMMVAEDDVLMAYGTLSGTNTGPMMGMPPTNKAWSSDYVDVIRFNADMKMKEHWGVYDQLKMMKDLGLLAPPREMQMDTTKKI